MGYWHFHLLAQVEWVQTARFKDGSTHLLKDMPPMEMESMKTAPAKLTLTIDTSKKYQELVGFGGAFTEASAINWRQLSESDQDEVIKLTVSPNTKNEALPDPNDEKELIPPLDLVIRTKWHGCLVDWNGSEPIL